MRGQEDRGWEGEGKQAAVAAGSCEKGEEGGKPAQMMGEECFSCISSGFALHCGAHVPALPWGCQWDWEGIAHADCSKQKAANCTGFILPSSSALISDEMVNIF